MAKLGIRNSEIEGRGMVVLDSVKKNTIISIIKGKNFKKENKTLQDVFGHPDWVGIGKNIWIDPNPPYKYINHSCNPSAGIKGKVTLVALRDLKAGEEVTLDYSTIEADTRWRLPNTCRCGSKNCRKVIGPIQALPKDRFKTYYPYISTYFKKLYLRKVLQSH